MEFRSVKLLLWPLIGAGHRWQYIDINGNERRPRLYFSGLQLMLLIVSFFVALELKKGFSKDAIGYVMSAFAISVSLFMGLLISIFDKFDKTDFALTQWTQSEKVRLMQKKNFFKRFVSITSYLVVLSILVILLCSLSYIFDIYKHEFRGGHLTLDLSKIDWHLTLKNVGLLTYRATLNYFLLNYLLLALFITGSSFEYYMSEISNRKITVKEPQD